MSSTTKYTKMTESDLKDKLTQLSSGLFEQIQPESRSFYAHTGAAGYASYMSAIEVHVIQGLFEYVKTQFTEQEVKAIQEMINSKDSRDLVMARAIIETKQKQHEHSI